LSGTARPQSFAATDGPGEVNLRSGAPRPGEGEDQSRHDRRRGAKRREAKRLTRAALTLRPSGDYLAQTSVFWMESSRERRHYIRSVGYLSPVLTTPVLAPALPHRIRPYLPKRWPACTPRHTVRKGPMIPPHNVPAPRVCSHRGRARAIDDMRARPAAGECCSHGRRTTEDVA